MRYALGAICLMAICLASLAEAANENFTVVLHARTPGGSGSCTVTGLPTCLPGSDPNTQIAPDDFFRVYIFIANHTGVSGLLTGLSAPAGWTINPDVTPLFGCQTNQLTVATPGDPPGSPTLGTAFECFQTGLCLVGRLDVQAGPSGCLTQVNPAQGSMRVEVLDCQNVPTSFDASDPLNLPRLGTICVGVPGVNSCQPTAVEPATWGEIKASYR